MNPDYYMKVSKQVKEFYTELPNYAANYTDFNCGHMAAHYSANKLKADEIHLYGFDSIFDFCAPILYFSIKNVQFFIPKLVFSTPSRGTPAE